MALQPSSFFSRFSLFINSFLRLGHNPHFPQSHSFRLALEGVHGYEHEFQNEDTQRKILNVQEEEENSKLFGENGERDGSMTERVGLWEGIVLMAVPKSKVSLTRKRVRWASRALPLVKNYTQCPVCENFHMIDHICAHCFKKDHKASKKQLLEKDQEA